MIFIKIYVDRRGKKSYDENRKERKLWYDIRFKTENAAGDERLYP